MSAVKNNTPDNAASTEHTHGLIELAETAQARGDFGAAEAYWRQALAARPADPRLLNGLGTARYLQGDLDGALDAYNSALSLSPEFALALSNTALALVALGRHDDALVLYDRAIAQIPNSLALWRNRLCCLLYMPGLEPATVLNASLEFARNFAPASRHRLQPMSAPAKRSGPWKVAFLGSDFYQHPVARNLRPLFAERDAAAFSFGIYANVAAPDDVTEWFKRRADWWCDIGTRSDRDVAELVRADRVDVLVLLAGRFDRNRCTVAGWRAAPVQVSMFDGGTSGSDDMDFWLTDATLHPASTTELFTESLFRLPVLFCYGPIEPDTPEPGPLPASERGHIAFGCFGNPAKISDATIELWSGAMQLVARSTLLLKYKGLYRNSSIRARVVAQFAKRGIGAERIQFIDEPEGRRNHLEHYRAIDIALDTYPFSGATSTFEALSMGVPVVTLGGDKFVERMSASLLAALGLHDLIVESPAAFAVRVAALSADLKFLGSLRLGLRERLAGSPLCDSRGYARAVEQAFLKMLQLHRTLC